MKLAIIGAGNVGRALAKNLGAKGYDIVFGVRDPAASQDLGQVAMETHSAAQSAPVILLATPWGVTPAICDSLAPLTGKIVIDCTNPLSMVDGRLRLDIGFATSAGEIVAQRLPGANVFKSFNQIGAEAMADTSRFSMRPLMYVAGDDSATKPTVLKLVEDAGFEALDAGPIEAARLLEPLAMLWIDQAFNLNRGRDFAFALTRVHN